MPCPTKRTRFGDLVFDVYEDVYEPAEDSFLFAENLDVQAGDDVLDVGTGSGILAVLAAKQASNVVAVDLSPFAIRCARENAKLNHVLGKISFIQADLFTALFADVEFDLILFNAPYLPSEEGEEASWIGRSWAGGTSGREVVDRFITQVPAYLKPDGRILLMQSTLTGVQETLNQFSAVNFEASVKASQKLPFFETLTLIEAKRRP
jgi:release factor glutamine methyltransferase